MRDPRSGWKGAARAALRRSTSDFGIPCGAQQPVHVEPVGGLPFVSDRGHDRVVAYDPEDWSPVGAVPADPVGGRPAVAAPPALLAVSSP